jgi:hypothetical protein
MHAVSVPKVSSFVIEDLILALVHGDGIGVSDAHPVGDSRSMGHYNTQWGQWEI